MAKIPDGSIDLFATAQDLIKAKGSFELEEVINNSFLRACNG